MVKGVVDIKRNFVIISSGIMFLILTRSKCSGIMISLWRWLGSGWFGRSSDIYSFCKILSENFYKKLLTFRC